MPKTRAFGDELRFVDVLEVAAGGALHERRGRQQDRRRGALLGRLGGRDVLDLLANALVPLLVEVSL
jgi:hypothetical protein